MYRAIRLTAACLTVVVLTFAAPIMAAFPGTNVFLPSVGRGPGVAPSQWYTSVWVHNPNPSSVNVTFRLLERNTANLSPRIFNDLIPPGDTRLYDNAVWLMFGEESFGALRVTSDSKVVVASRIYSQPGSDVAESSGQYFAAVPASFAITAGGSTEILGVHQTVPHVDSQFRFNFGFVETSGGTLEVRVTISDESGLMTDSKNYSLRQYEARQLALRDEFPGFSGDNSRLTITALSGTGSLIAFGSCIANKSQDPSTAEMLYDEALLAGSSGSGSISEITAGEGLTGGGVTGAVALHVGAGDGIVVTDDAVGVADGGITRSKLAASGASSGQVLGTDGSGLIWQDMALTLPFTAQQASDGYLVTVENTSGPAIKVIGSTRPALVAESSTNTAVYGKSFHQNSTGVVGEAGVADAWGVRGINPFKNTEGVLGATHGVYGRADLPAMAGFFLGNVQINGELTAGAFKDGSVDSADVSFNYAGSATKGGAASAVTCSGCVSQSDLASDAVNLRHIDASGAAAGTFLSTNGTSLSWQLPSGFALPYAGSGSASHPNGLFDITNTGSGFAVGGHATSSAGVYGTSSSRGVHGDSTGPGGVGVLGTGAGFGVKGLATASGSVGVYGETTDDAGVGVSGANTSSNSSGHLGGTHGVFGHATGSNKAGYFDGDALVTGDLHVGGTLTAGAKAFRIDHPLAPKDRILNHISVESSEMLTVYSGNLVLGAAGSARVDLPSWFEALNADFRYQLTPIGAPAAGLYVAREIADNSFVVAGGAPGLKVSWQVTAVRDDPYARTDPVQIEEEKSDAERGRYLHPQAYR